MDSTLPRPVLSVGVPLLDREGRISRCLDSLTHPDGPVARADLEILVVDDGSAADALAVARTYEAKHPGVRLLSCDGGGMGAALDCARLAANGVYFLVVDSDDEVLPAALRKAVSFLRWVTDRGLAIDALMLDGTFRDERSGVRSGRDFRRVLPSNRTFGWNEIGRSARRGPFSLQTLVYRRGLLEEAHLHLPQNTCHVDGLYAFTPLLHATRFYYLPFPLLLRSVGRDGPSVSVAFARSRTEDRMRISRALVAEMDRIPDSVVRRQRRYLDDFLASFLVETLSVLSLSDRDDREQKKAGLLDWIRRTHRETYRMVARRPWVALARRQGAFGRFIARIGCRLADAGRMLA